MTKFRDGFMMKSPMKAHKDIMEQMKAKSKESSGRDDALDYDNPEVVELKKEYDKEKQDHAGDGPLEMATASYRRTPMDTETYYGGEIDVPDITSVGTLAGAGIDSLESQITGKGEKNFQKNLDKKLEKQNQCGPGTKMENGQCVPE